MFLRDYNEAEAYLQMAARWAQDKTTEITCMSNLGALCWMKSTDSIRYSSGYDLQITEPSKKVSVDRLRRWGLFTMNRGNVLVGATAPAPAPAASSTIHHTHEEATDTGHVEDISNVVSEGDEAILVASANEALSYWDDAIDIAVQSTNDDIKVNV